MTIDLFAGIPVRDYTAAVAWYERPIGAPPSFLPDHTEAFGGEPARPRPTAASGLVPQPGS